jgi:uncharacterized protein YbaR (Trm112 family)
MTRGGGSGAQPDAEGALISRGAILMDESELSSPPARGTTRIDPRLLEVLVCPVTRSTLSYDSARQELISRAAKLAYPIRDGVPIMLPEEARPLEG